MTGSKNLDLQPLEVDSDGDIVNPHYAGDMFIKDVQVYQNNEDKTSVRLLVMDTSGNEMALDITSSSNNYRGIATKWAETTTQYVAVHSPLPFTE